MVDNKKRKIAFFISDMSAGGAEKGIAELIGGFDKGKFDYSLILREAKGVFLIDIPASVNIVELRKQFIFFEIFQIINLIKNEKYDIFISLLIKESIISLLAKIFLRNKVKVIVLVQTNLSQIKATASFFLKSLVKLLYPFADRIICVSNGVAEDIYNIIGKSSKIVVIYNPINAEKILELSKEAVEDKLLVKNYPNILAVGRLVKAKDYPTLLMAICLVKGKKNIKLVILGAGREKDNLLEMAKELGVEKEVIFGGFKKNPYKYMAKADIFILSSVREGFGNVIVEAMICGVPVISTDCKSGPNEIIENERNGLLVPVQDEKSLAEAILRLLDNKNLGEKFSNEGKKISQKFSLEKSVEEYENIFNELLK